MLSHDRIWTAIDRLAARHGISASALARRAGLDATTFNQSKRIAGDGRPRWPSTESIAKILDATGSDFDEFLDLMDEAPAAARATLAAEPATIPGPVFRPPAAFARPVPLLGFAQAGAGGFFDDGGFPAGQGWDEVAFPGQADPVYALEVSGESMLPLYRDGDVIIVSPTAPCRRGDRVVVRTREGEVMAKILQRKTNRTVELASLNPSHETRNLKLADLDWMARIIWASQ